MKKINKKSMLALIALIIAGGLMYSTSVKSKAQLTRLDDRTVIAFDKSEIKNEATTKRFKARYQAISSATNPLEDAIKARDSGDYVAAEKKIRESLALHIQYGINEWLPRYQLAEILELQGKNEEAIGAISWLMASTTNAETIKELQFRKDTLSRTVPGTTPKGRNGDGSNI